MLERIKRLLLILRLLAYRDFEREVLAEAMKGRPAPEHDDRAIEELHQQALAYFGEDPTPIPPALPAPPAPPQQSPPLLNGHPSNGETPKRPRGRPRKHPRPPGPDDVVDLRY